MADQKSLADSAVDVLAAVSRMDFGLTNEHEERHQVRTLKRLAESALAEAFRHARDLAWLAEDVRKTSQDARDAAVQKSKVERSEVTR
jgi:hypothetical protein